MIEARGNEELNEQKLKLLMNEKLSAGSQRVLAEELFPNLSVPFSAAYVKKKMPPAYSEPVIASVMHMKRAAF